MEVPALLIFAEDFPRRNFGDWLAAHMIFALPPHRYAGNLAVKESGIFFSGTDTLEARTVEIRIPRHRIEEVFIGYDDVYSAWQVRSLGLFWSPVRLKFTTDTGQTSTLYLITGYDRIGTTNRDFYRFLTEWIS